MVLSIGTQREILIDQSFQYSLNIIDLHQWTTLLFSDTLPLVLTFKPSLKIVLKCSLQPFIEVQMAKECQVTYRIHRVIVVMLESILATFGKWLILWCVLFLLKHWALVLVYFLVDKWVLQRLFPIFIVLKVHILMQLVLLQRNEVEAVNRLQYLLELFLFYGHN